MPVATAIADRPLSRSLACAGIRLNERGSFSRRIPLAGHRAPRVGSEAMQQLEPRAVRCGLPGVQGQGNCVVPKSTHRAIGLSAHRSAEFSSAQSDFSGRVQPDIGTTAYRAVCTARNATPSRHSDFFSPLARRTIPLTFAAVPAKPKAPSHEPLVASAVVGE